MSTPWTGHRARALALRDRHLHAEEVLTLYLALVGVWEEAWAERETAGQIVPKVVKATVEYGPSALGDEVRRADESVVAAWLGGAELSPAECFLARAALRAPFTLSARTADAPDGSRTADTPDGTRTAGASCPLCGGPPQLSHREGADDGLVSGGRYLQCGLCGHDWSFSASTCPSCGETGSKRTVYAETTGSDKRVGRPKPGDAAFPHLRIEGCHACDHYLIDIDLGRDAQAVPEVDELTAIPLDLYAAERGLSKIIPNLMGF